MATLNPSLGDRAVTSTPHGHAGHHEIGFIAEVRLLDRSQDHRHPVPLLRRMIMLMVGGALALAVRWQLAWPWSHMPIVGQAALRRAGGRMSPEFYTMLFTMHASVMIFFVIIPFLAGAFGNLLIPLMIGADDMAFPTLNMLSYWFMWPAIVFFMASFFAEAAARRRVGPSIRRCPTVKSGGTPGSRHRPDPSGCWH